MQTSCQTDQQPAAFTLLEMLVVIALLVLVMTVALPALRGVKEGRTLDATADQLAAQLQLARQQAITLNRDVEVRFYAFETEAGHELRGMQLFKVEPEGRRTALAGWFPFPEGVILSRSSADSSLSILPSTVPDASDPALPPPVGTAYTFYPIVFQRHGGPAHLPAPFYLTLRTQGRTHPGRTVTLDAATGRVGLIKP